MAAPMLAALLAGLQSVEFDVAEPFKQCMQIGYALSAYGDWDKDGHADFLISAPQTIFDSRLTVALVSGKDGRGLLVLREEAERGELNWFGARLGTHADIDGDARPEIVVGTGTRGALVCSSKDGTTLYRLADVAAILVNDVDDDGHRDWLVRQTVVLDGVAHWEFVSGKSGARIRSLSQPAELSSSAQASDARLSTFFRVRVAGDLPGVAKAVVEVVGVADGESIAKRTLEFPASLPEAELCTTADVDRDGKPDLLLSLFDDAVHSADDAEERLYSRVFVLSGADLSTLRELSSPDSPARFGYSIASGADVNADGYDDVLVSEYGDMFVDGTRFRVSLYSGKDGQLLRDDHRPTTGRNEFGARVSFVGDADADGTPDYAVSALYIDDSTTTEPGAVSLFSGKSGALLRTWEHKFTEQR